MKKIALIILVMCLAACSTGIGRGFSQAISGIPPEIAVIPDALEAEYDRNSSYMMKDIVASPIPEGNVAAATNKAAAVTDHQARIDAFHLLVENLRTYMGVEKGGDPLATFNNAAENRKKLLEGGTNAVNRWTGPGGK